MDTHNGITLVLGGARSGKSRYAQALAERLWAHPGFLASAEALDGEMRQRIAQHQADRGPAWRTIEEPLEVARVFRAPPAGLDGILWDCATLWLSNVLLREGEDGMAARQADLLDALSACPCPVILVSNEVGLGLVPPTPLGRAFRDAAGRLNQALAAAAVSVTFLAAGLPLPLKPARE